MKGILAEPGKAPVIASLPDSLWAIENRLGTPCEMIVLPRTPAVLFVGRYEGPIQPGQNAQNPVIFAARRLGIEMAAHIDRSRIGIGPGADEEHVPHRIDAHGHPGRLGPSLEQMPAFIIGIGQGLAVVATGDTGAHLGHFHQTVPQSRGVDAEVRSGCWHGFVLPVVGLLTGPHRRRLRRISS